MSNRKEYSCKECKGKFGGYDAPKFCPLCGKKFAQEVISKDQEIKDLNDKIKKLEALVLQAVEHPNSVVKVPELPEENGPVKTQSQIMRETVVNMAIWLQNAYQDQKITMADMDSNNYPLYDTWFTKSRFGSHANNYKLRRSAINHARGKKASIHCQTAGLPFNERKIPKKSKLAQRAEQLPANAPSFEEWAENNLDKLKALMG